MSNNRFKDWLWPRCERAGHTTYASLGKACGYDESTICKMFSLERTATLRRVLPVLIHEGIFSSEEEVFAGLDLIPIEAFGKKNPQKRIKDIKDAVFEAFDEPRKSGR